MTREENLRQWEDAKARLSEAYTAFCGIGKDSPYYKDAVAITRQLTGLVQQAWLAGSPLNVKTKATRKTKRTGRPKVQYIDDETVSLRLIDVMAHIIKERFEGGKMLLDTGKSVPPSKFFACVYSSVYEHGMSKADNLHEFATLMRKAAEKAEMADDFTLQYDAIYSQIKKWNNLSTKGGPYDYIHLYTIAQKDVPSDEGLRSEFQSWKSLYDEVTIILTNEGLYPN